MSRNTLLAERMREAANTLEEASELYDAFDKANHPWTATDLRREATHVENEEETDGV